jgi:FtsZ-interacting cell division protein ZipA
MNSAVPEGRTTHDDRLERSGVERDINDDGMVAESDDERIERVYDEPDQEAQQYRVTPEEHQLRLQEQQQQQFQQQRMMGQESDMDLEDDRPPGKRVKVRRHGHWQDDVLMLTVLCNENAGLRIAGPELA